MIFHILLAYLLIKTAVSFKEECTLIRSNIASCPSPMTTIPHFVFTPELINLNAIKYPHGTTAMLVCPPNQYLEVHGSRWRVCNNGTWSGPFGKCKPLGT
uniref:Sushi domain-containing protein n=1 Tax=Onchocerca volvulus TaxID=6282 RepID=A0A8R1XZI9_ONCVO